MKYSAMVHDLVRNTNNRGVSCHQINKELPSNYGKKGRENDLKKSYIIDENPKCQQMFKDVGNLSKNRNEYTPSRYSARNNFMSGEFEGVGKGKGNKNVGEIERFKEMKSYRGRNESVNVKQYAGRDTSGFGKSVSNNIQVPSYFESAASKYNSKPNNHQYFSSQKMNQYNSQNVPILKPSNSIIQNIDKVQQKIRSLLGSK